MTSPAAIVHPSGYPGAGKYTVAKQLARVAERAGQRVDVIDNHHTSNVIFAVLDVDVTTLLPEDAAHRILPHVHSLD